MTMQNIAETSPESKSADLLASNVEQLNAMFPELITEGPQGAAVNLDVLKALVGDRTLTDSDEKYGLNWHGKRGARQIALTPSSGTLRPCPEDSVEWNATQNLMIEGDNLEVLKLLQKSYAGKVKLIYIDPPYNTGKDFVYPDNFQDNIKNYLEITGQSQAGLAVNTNAESSGRFHTDWLNMIYPRLKLARTLLKEDGVIFISIDHGELSSLKAIMDEVFGEENFVNIFNWVRTRTPASLSQKSKNIVEYIICYERSKNAQPLLGIAKPAQSANTLLNQPNAVSTLVFPAGIETGIPDGQIKPGLFGSDSYDVELLDAVTVKDGVFTTPFKLRARFRWSQDYLDQQILDGTKVRIATSKLLPSYEKDSYGREALPNLIDESVNVGTNETAGSELTSLMGCKIFDYPKPTSLIKYLVNSCTANDDIVVDFFAGSGTTAHSVLSQNAEDGNHRRFILVQLPELLDSTNKDQKLAAEFCISLGKKPELTELTKERVRRSIAKIKDEHSDCDVDLGFRVFKLDNSNIRGWNPRPENLESSLLEQEDHLLEGRTEADVLYELLIKLGLDLCVPIEKKTIVGMNVLSVGGGVLMTCLTEKITSDQVDALAKGIVDWHKELEPAGDTTCVFRDSAFADDVAKTNMAAILEQHGIQNVRSL